MEAYSRDAMASPLRHLVATLAKVRGGTFLPDTTRSGYFASAASISTTSSRSTSPAPSTDIDPDDLKDDGLIDEYCVNTRTKFVHIIVGDHLSCGKAIPVLHKFHSTAPAEARRCARCF